MAMQLNARTFQGKLLHRDQQFGAKTPHVKHPGRQDIPVLPRSGQPKPASQHSSEKSASTRPN